MARPGGAEGARPRTIRVAEGGQAVEIIDQTRLPFELCIRRLETLEDAAEAIAQMRVRGAPLIGATAATASAWRCSRTPPTPRSRTPAGGCSPPARRR